MKMLITFNDLNHEGKNLYGRGNYTRITKDMVRPDLIPMMEQAELVRMLLPDDQGIDFDIDASD